MPRDTSRYDRSRKYESSDSSDSEYSSKSSKRKRSDRSKRSLSREKSYRHRRRSSSRNRKKNKRSASRSPSKYRSSRKRSCSRDRISKKRYSRSSSRDRSYSRDRSRSRDKSETTRNKHRRTKSSKHESKKRSSSRSQSPQEREGLLSLEASKKYIIDDTVSKIEKAIKAAEAAGLKMCKLPSPEYKDVKIKEDMPTIQDRNVLDELNSDSFTQRQFTSSRTKKLPENIVIDLEAGSIKVPEIEIPKVESLFHPDFFQDDKVRMEKWVKKLFLFRQKALKGEI